MTTSLRSVTGNGYGFGVRPMRGSIINNRKKLYIANALHHPVTPNGAFYRIATNTALFVIGADGNQSGTAAASALIDGSAQIFSESFFLFTESDNYCWLMVSNAANEFRLVRANYAGAITTPGAKFTPITPTNFTGRVFVYESGANLVIRTSNSGVLYEHVISKATGQLVSQNTVIETDVSPDPAVYHTVDGLIKFGYFYFGVLDVASVIGLSVNNTILPNPLKLSVFDIFGKSVDATGHYVPVLSGKYITLIPLVNQGNFSPLPLIERTEFDRWLRDVVNKFKIVS